MDASLHARLPCRDPIQWTKICSALTDLRAKCVFFNRFGSQAALQKYRYRDAKFWLRDAICTYNQNAKILCDFNVVQSNREIISRFIQVLPKIIDNALSLPDRVRTAGGSIPILKHGENRVVMLNRNLICSLLANALLSTLPYQGSNEISNINFWRLYHEGNRENKEVKSKLKAEKLKCILEYFEKMGNGDKLPNTEMTFERVLDRNKVDWVHSTAKLTEMKVVADRRIEDAEGMLQVDFANKKVGGGVLGSGNVQEEIRFSISPELIVGRLITERLGCDEVLRITGTRQFSSYTGYGSTFKFARIPGPDFLKQKVITVNGRECTQVVAMDAIAFKPHNKDLQYKMDLVDRELHKSYLAFLRDSGLTIRDPFLIATGNWGCGAFNGDTELKFLIQWMAASENKRGLLFHARNEEQRSIFENMVNFLLSKQITIGKLYEMLQDYEKKITEWSSLRIQKQRTLFAHIKNYPC